MSSRTRYYNRYTPYRSGVATRARRQQRAADQQRDTTTIVINSNMSFDCGQTMAQIYMDKGDDGWFDTGCAAINIYDVLRKSDYFSEFSNLYDQFRVDNIRARIIATNWATSREESSTQKINEIIKQRSYVIVTAWDRTGVSRDDIVFGPRFDSGEITDKVMYVSIGKKIDTYSSAKTKHLGPGNAYEIVRQLYPENNYEKSQYISTALLKGQQIRTNTENFAYNCYYKRVVPQSVNANGYEYVPIDLDPSNPCNLMSDPAIGFKPTLLVDVIAGPSPMVTDIKDKDPDGFTTITTIGVNKIKPVTFDVEFEIAVTFRGLRYNRNIDNTNIKYVPNEVKPLYSLIYSEGDGSNNNIRPGPQDIRGIYLSDSKYLNQVNINYPFQRNITKTYSALPSNEQSRYIVYLHDGVESVINPADGSSEASNYKTIYVINCGNYGFTKEFKNDDVYLFDFLSDNYNEDGIDDYVNIKMYIENNEPGYPMDPVYSLSTKIDVPLINSNDTAKKGKLLCVMPDNYYFVPQSNNNNQNNNNENMEVEDLQNDNP